MNEKILNYGLAGACVNKHIASKVLSKIFKAKYKLYSFKTYPEFEDFLLDKKFLYLNIGSPYKTSVIKLLDSKSSVVERTNVCDLVVNCKGLLKGYNVEYLGFKHLFKTNGINIQTSSFLIIGTGASSSTIQYILKENKCCCFDIISYKELVEHKSENCLKNKYDYIINTTEFGKKRKDKHLIDLRKFSKTKCYIDLVVNPLRTNMMIEAKSLGIGTISGLESMLEILKLSHYLGTGVCIPSKIWHYAKVMTVLDETNIVVFGMPYSGKSSFVKDIARIYEIDEGIIETNNEIEKVNKMSASKFKQLYGNEAFLHEEKQLASILSMSKGLIIATSDTMILDDINYYNFSNRAIMIYMKRSNFDTVPDKLLKRDNLSKELLYKMYEQRKKNYESKADLVVVYDHNSQYIFKEIINALESIF